MELLKARGGPGLLPPEEKPVEQFFGTAEDRQEI